MLVFKEYKSSSKRHTCSLCGNTIFPTEKYKIYYTTDKMRMYSYILCKNCCKTIGHIKKISNIDISNDLDMCIVNNDKEKKINNMKILNDNIEKYCVGKIGNSIEEVKYNINKNLI